MDDLRKTIDEQGLLAGLRTLVTAFDGNSEAMGKVFEDTEGLLGVLALTGPAAEENAAIIDAVTAAHGDLDRALKPVLETLGGRGAQVFGNFNAQLVDMGARLAPTVHMLFNMADAALNMYSALGDGPKEFVATIISLGPALIAAGVAAKGLSFALGGFSPAARGVIAAAGLMSSSLKIVASGVTAAFDAAWTAIKLRAGATFGVLRGGGRAAFEAFQTAGIAAMQGIRNAARVTVAPINAVIDAVQRHGVFGSMRLSAQKAFAAIRASAGKLRTSLIANFAAIGTAARLMWVAIGGPVGLVIGAAALALIAAWKPVSTFFMGLWQGLTDGASDINAAFQRLFDALGPIGGGIRNVFGGVGSAWTTLANLFDDQSDVGRGWGDAIIDGAVAVVDGITAVVTWFNRLFGVIGTVIEDPFGWLEDAWANLMQSLLEMIPAPIKAMLGGASDLLGSVGRTVMQGAGEGLEGAGEGLERATEWIRGWFPGSDAKRGPLSDITESGRSLISTFADGVMQAAPGLASIFSSAIPSTQSIDSPASAAPLQTSPAAGELRAMAAQVLPAIADSFVAALGEFRTLIGQAFPNLEDALASVFPVGPLAGQAPDLQLADSFVAALGEFRTLIGQAFPNLEDALASVLPVGPLAGQSPDLQLADSLMAALGEFRTLTGQAFPNLEDALASVLPVGPLAGQAGEFQSAPALADALSAALPVGPSAGDFLALQTQRASLSGGRGPLTVNIGEIKIVAPDGDPTTIATAIGDALRDQVRRAVESADSTEIV